MRWNPRDGCWSMGMGPRRLDSGQSLLIPIIIICLSRWLSAIYNQKYFFSRPFPILSLKIINFIRYNLENIHKTLIYVIILLNIENAMDLVWVRSGFSLHFSCYQRAQEYSKRYKKILSNSFKYKKKMIKRILLLVKQKCILKFLILKFSEFWKLLKISLKDNWNIIDGI